MKRIVLVFRPQHCVRFQPLVSLLRLVQHVSTELSVVILSERLVPPIGTQVSALTGDIEEFSLEEVHRELKALEERIEKEIAALRRQLSVPLSIRRLSVLSELEHSIPRPSLLLEFAMPVLADLQQVFRTATSQMIGCLLPRKYGEQGYLDFLGELSHQLQLPVVCLSDIETSRALPVPEGVTIIQTAEPLNVAAVRDFLHRYQPTVLLVPRNWLREAPEVREFLTLYSSVPVLFVSEQE